MNMALSMHHQEEAAGGAEDAQEYAEQERQRVNPSMLDALQLESLVLNLDASLRVHARSHFFMWTQGLLQSLVPHDVLICALRGGDRPALRVDSFSTVVTDASIFTDLFLHDPSVAAARINEWKRRHYRPVVCEAARTSALCGGALARQLEQIGATQIIAHGGHDTDGEVTGIFIFACRSGRIGPTQMYIVQLVAPFLYAAWVRSRMEQTPAADRAAPAGVRALTAREQEILRWICLGKSNNEVGSILKISPLTVKNHVQKILRKLNVVNRTQAVGKALDARILGL